jgi:hypothetical protein
MGILQYIIDEKFVASILSSLALKFLGSPKLVLDTSELLVLTKDLCGSPGLLL